jgi:hypothetical protein
MTPDEEDGIVRSKPGDVLGFALLPISKPCWVLREN